MSEMIYVEMDTEVVEQLKRIANALEKLTEPVIVVEPRDKKVDTDGPVDRAGRFMRYTDGTDIPIDKRVGIKEKE